MTLLWFDGFEGVDTTAYIATDFNGNSYSTAAATAFNYGLSLGNSSGSGARYIAKAVTASAQLFVGGRWYISGYSQVICSLWADSGAVEHIRILVNAFGGIEIWRGPQTTLLAASASGLVQPLSWFYAEVSCTVADSGGVVEVRLNGGPTPVVTYTGDTRNAGTSTNLDRIRWYCYDNGTSRFDDLYVCNSLGTQNNTFLGDVQAYGHFPTAAGADTGLTPSVAPNWGTVDEVTPVATDYNGSSVVGTRDLYNVNDLPAGTSAVLGVRLNMHAHKSDAGLGQMKAAIKSGSSTVYESTEVLAGAMTAYNYAVRETDPATSAAWTVSGVNAVQIGAEVA